MKKNLLTTTAIVAAGMLAMSATADAQGAPRGMPGGGTIKLGVGGYMEQLFGFADNERAGGIGSPATAPAIAAAGGPTVSDRAMHFDVNSEAEVWFKGWARLDNGITIIADIQLEGNNFQSATSSATDQIDESYMIVRGKFGQFTIGSEDNAAYLMTIGYAGTWATGVGETISFSGDNWIMGPATAGAGTSPKYLKDVLISGTAIDNDSEKITYFTPRYMGFQLGFSYIPQNTQDADGSLGTGAYHGGYAIGANYTGNFSGTKVGVAGGWLRFQAPEQIAPIAAIHGAATNRTDNPFAWNIAGSVEHGKWKFAATYRRTGNIVSAAGGGTKLDGAAWSVGARYNFGKYRASLGYVETYHQGLNEGVNPNHDRYQMLQAAVATDLAKGVKLMTNFYYGEISDESSRVTGAGALAGQQYDAANSGWAINAGVRLTF